MSLAWILCNVLETLYAAATRMRIHDLPTNPARVHARAQQCKPVSHFAVIRTNAQVTCIILSLWMPSGLHGYNLLYPYEHLLFEKRNMVKQSPRAASIRYPRAQPPRRCHAAIIDEGIGIRAISCNVEY